MLMLDNFFSTAIQLLDVDEFNAGVTRITRLRGSSRARSSWQDFRHGNLQYPTECEYFGRQRYLLALISSIFAWKARRLEG